MAFENLFAGAKEMLEKAKHLVEDTTGISVDKIEESLAHPGDLMDKAKAAIANPSELLDEAKAKGAELFNNAKAQVMGGSEAHADTADKAPTETK